MEDPNIEHYKEIHATEQYGDTSVKNLRYILPQVELLSPKTIVDYGCGRSKLLDILCNRVEALGTRYDPAIPEYSCFPTEKFDLLINIDVLEHIPENRLDETVGGMADICNHAIIVIDTRPAEKILPSGENAHCTLKSHEWWGEYLKKYFTHVEPIRVVRKSRAAFRTWTLTASQQRRLKLRIASEKIKYRLRKTFLRASVN